MWGRTKATYRRVSRASRKNIRNRRSTSPFTARLLATARGALSLGRSAYRAGNRAVAARAMAVAKRAFKLARLSMYVQMQSRGLIRTSRIMHSRVKAAQKRAASTGKTWSRPWNTTRQFGQRRRRGAVSLAKAPAWAA
ncbi:MAG: hypothetical protein ACTHU0_31890 [Kofleriaceae bacterium]